MPDEPVPLRVAAQQFDVPLERLRKGANEKRLITEKPGFERLVRPSEVERFIRAGGRKPAPQPPAPVREGAPMGRIVAVAILKGGTAKTTTTLNLGAALAEQGHRVLLIDTDPQSNLTTCCGLVRAPEPTLATAMLNYIRNRAKTLEQTIVETSLGTHVRLVPASLLLSRLERELVHAPRREYVLQELLTSVAPQYDVVLIDTPPSAGDLATNALVAAHEVMIPVSPEPLAVDALAYSLEDIAKIRETKLNPDLHIRGVIITQVDRRRMQHREAVEQIRESYGAEVRIFDTVIADSTRIVESQLKQVSVLQYDPKGPSAVAYRALADEVLHEWQPAT